ncbi:proteasome accessory factor PafA2, partial [Staphylococcus aureus]
PTLKHELLLADGQRSPATALLRKYMDRWEAHDGVDKQVLELWDEILTDLERDPLSTADRLDWTAKWALLKGYTDRGVSWSD